MAERYAERGEVCKSSICVVDVTGGGQTHYRKITVALPPEEAQRMIDEVFAGHVVSRKKGAGQARDLRRNQA